MEKSCLFCNEHWAFVGRGPILNFVFSAHSTVRTVRKVIHTCFLAECQGFILSEQRYEVHCTCPPIWLFLSDLDVILQIVK
jgi:hypothetical protein